VPPAAALTLTKGFMACRVAAAACAALRVRGHDVARWAHRRLQAEMVVGWCETVLDRTPLLWLLSLPQ
jgi:hypothetical protein